MFRQEGRQSKSLKKHITFIQDAKESRESSKFMILTRPLFSFTRLDSNLLRRFCSAAGYGWDFPDSEGRDLPLCFPELLFLRLMLLVLSDDHFSLSPAGKATC